MAKLYNLARMSSLTTGSGTLVLASPIQGCLSFVNAGVGNGETISYGIIEGANSEVGRGVYTTSGSTLTRSVIKSTNSNNPIILTGGEQVYVQGFVNLGSFSGYSTITSFPVVANL
jgi:hypothetical protein